MGEIRVDVYDMTKFLSYVLRSGNFDLVIPNTSILEFAAKEREIIPGEDIVDGVRMMKVIGDDESGNIIFDHGDLIT